MINKPKNKISPYLYEYCPSVLNATNLSDDRWHFLYIPIESRYILLKENRTCIYNIITQSNIYAEITKLIDYDKALILDISKMKIQLIGHYVPRVKGNDHYNYSALDSSY